MAKLMALLEDMAREFPHYAICYYFRSLSLSLSIDGMTKPMGRKIIMLSNCTPSTLRTTELRTVETLT